MPSQPQRRQDERLVVGITGRIGSGKTSVGTYLSSRHSFQYLRYSQVLAEWKAHDPESRSHLQQIGWDVMAGGMQPELNRRLIQQINPDADVAVDGLRHPVDYDSLSSRFSSSFRLIFIDCPDEIRWYRLREKYPEREKFDASEAHLVEQNIESLKNRSSAMIHNQAALPDLYATVDRIIQQFRKEGLT